jgi:hypothetical protein
LRNYLDVVLNSHMFIRRQDSSDSHASSNPWKSEDLDKSSFVRRGSSCLPLLSSYLGSSGRSSSVQGENPRRASKDPSPNMPHDPSPVPEESEHSQDSLAGGGALPPPPAQIPAQIPEPVLYPVQSLGRRKACCGSRNLPELPSAAVPDIRT